MISRRRDESAKICGFLRKSAFWVLCVTLVPSPYRPLGQRPVLPFLRAVWFDLQTKVDGRGAANRTLRLSKIFNWGQKINANFFCTKFFENPLGHGHPHRKSWTSAPKSAFFCGPVLRRNFLTPGHPGVRVRNVRRKSGPKGLCLCCFSSQTLTGRPIFIHCWYWEEWCPLYEDAEPQPSTG